MTTIKQWDDCIECWYNNYKDISEFLVEPIAQFGSMITPRLEYLPEPYYGDYHNCMAPVININPGLGSSDDVNKDWNYRNNPKGIWIHRSAPYTSCDGSCKPLAGQLLYDFEHKYGCKYSEWQKEYSPFVAPPCVPGVDWWKKNRNEYINRVADLYLAAKSGTAVKPLPQEEKDAANTFDKDLTPFALELCPLHSQTAPKFDGFPNATLVDNTIAPACISLKYSKIPFGLGFGAKVYQVLLDSGLFVECKKWENGCEVAGTSKTPIKGWPLANGKPINRTYALLKGICGKKVEFNGEELKFNDQCPYFLVTWCQGAFIKFTHQSMCDFDAVDQYIVDQIAPLA